MPIYRTVTAEEAFEETNGEKKVAMDLDYPERLKEFENLGLKVDLKFLVGPSEEVIKGHRFMFAEVSPAFKSMLYGTFKEAENTFDIRLPSDDPNIFKKLRQLIYSIDGSMAMKYMNLNVDGSISLYRLCDKYLIKSVTDIVIRHIKSLVKKATGSDLITLLIFADEFKMLLLSSHIWICTYRLSNYPTNITTLPLSLFLEFISRHSTRSGSNHTALFEIIELYLMDHKLMPKNLLNSKTEQNEEERKKHEILGALLIWIDVEELKRKPPQFKNMSNGNNFYKLMNNIKAKYK